MLFKKLIIPLTAALAISTVSYASDDDATILNFESNNLNENAITLK